MPRLTGKVALITGTGVGMGRAAALRFAIEGATVVGCDLNPQTSAETVELVRRAGGAMTATAPLDLSSYEATQRWVDDAAHAYSGIDLLYNNASLPVVGPWDELTVDDWHAGSRNEWISSSTRSPGRISLPAVEKASSARRPRRRPRRPLRGWLPGTATDAGR